MTILFADLVGYTSLSSRLDVEQVHLLVRPLMNGLRMLCLSLGGLVPAIEGDGFMAVFGALTTQEDDPSRAVLAAARMQQLAAARRQSHGESVPLLRVGINSGEVLVSPSWEQVGFSLSGDAVNVASRLCQLTAEGTVLVAQSTVDLFRYKDVWGDQQAVGLRNREESVLVRSLAWDRMPPSVSDERTSNSPFVERPALFEALHEATNGGGVVQLVGEPGVGKTRLAAEWVGRLPHHVVVHARIPTMGLSRASPLAPLIASLPPELRARVLPPGRTGRCLRRLLGEEVDSDELDTRGEQLVALVDVLARSARDSSLIVWLDDVHAMAGEEREALGPMCSAVAAAGGVVVLTSREAVHLPEARLLPVPVLSPDQARELATSLLDDVGDRVQEGLFRRTGGNPLFIEQCAQLLVEQDSLRVEGQRKRAISEEDLRQIPTIMRLFVASRFDLLDASQRAVVRAAAILSEDVEVDLLRHLSGVGALTGEVLESLVGRGLLRWHERGGPEPPVLQFCHQLVRDVAYEEITKQERIAVHRAAADWYGSLPIVQVLASEALHLEAAVALGGDDCALIRRAVQVLVYWARSVIDEQPLLAGEVLTRAQGLVDAHPRCEVDTLELLLAQAYAWEQGGHFAEASRAAAAAEQTAMSRDLAPEAALAALLRARATVLTAPADALPILEVAAARFAAIEDKGGLARVEVERARARAKDGLGPRVAAYTEAHRVALRSGDTRLASLAAQDLALHTSVTDVRAAETWSVTARDLLRSDDAVGLCRLATADALRALLRGDFHDAARLAHESRSLSDDSGAVQLSMMSLLYAIEARTLGGDLAGAQRLLVEARAVAESRVTDHLALDVDLHECLLLGRQGRVAEALHRLAQQQVRCRALNIDFERQRLLFAAQIAFDGGRFASADELASEAVALDIELGAAGLGLRSQFLLVVIGVVRRRHVQLRDVAQLRQQIKDANAYVLESALVGWTRLDDLLQGYEVHSIETDAEHAHGDGRALDLEVRALALDQPELLLEAANSWRSLGTTVWEARALIWHSELTGRSHPEAEAILDAIEAPAGLGDSFRSQVRRLRA